MVIPCSITIHYHFDMTCTNKSYNRIPFSHATAIIPVLTVTTLTLTSTVTNQATLPPGRLLKYSLFALFFHKHISKHPHFVFCHKAITPTYQNFFKTMAFRRERLLMTAYSTSRAATKLINIPFRMAQIFLSAFPQ